MNNLSRFYSFCESDDFGKLSEVIDKINDINAYDDDKGWNLIIVAAFNHSHKCVDLLLSNGADINSKNYKGTSVLMYAKTKVLKNGNVPFLFKLISNGADILHRDIYGRNIFWYLNESGAFFITNLIQIYSCRLSTERK